MESIEKNPKNMLKSEPSLSFYCESEDFLKSQDPVTINEANLERTVTIGDSVDAEFTFIEPIDFSSIKEEDKVLGFAKDEEKKLGFHGISGKEEIERPPSPAMHLAGGLGIDKFDLYGKEVTFDLPNFDDENCDDYYKRMLEDYPLHPLLLKNYAKFLEFKGDLNGAEEYYRQCTVVEPSDGIVLANYGRLVMKLHQDEAKALSYFERAVLASPEDSDVLAAYASFLWEINADEDDDDDDDDDGDDNNKDQTQQKKEQSEKSKKLESEVEDGETLCRYAKAFWSIKGDNEKALFYFEKAIEASPNDSKILGEYARFVWELEETDH